MFFKHVDTPNNAFWKYVVGTLVVAVCYVLGQFPLFMVIGGENVTAFMDNPDFTAFGYSKNLGLLLMLTIFIFALLGLYLFNKFIHNGKFRDLITWRAQIDWRKILFAFGFWMLLSISFEAVHYFINPELYHFRFNGAAMIPLLLLAIFILPIQTSAEEIFLRGYLFQGIGNATCYKWIPLVVTTILFGLIHMDNPEVDEYGAGIMLMYYLGAGLFLGIITIMDDSLELALGVHAATNFFAVIFVSYKGAVLQTDTLAVTDLQDPMTVNIIFFISAIIFTAVCYNKYKWKPFGGLLKPISQVNESTIEV